MSTNIKLIKKNNGFSEYLILGVKFGIFGALLGLVLHVLWGNLEELKYTILTCFIIGFFIGFLEIIFSKSKTKKLPYSLILLFRALVYFIIAIVSIYSLLIIYLKINGLDSSVLGNTQQFEDIKNVYFFTNVNTLYVLLFTLLASFFWQLKPFFVKGVLFNYLVGKYHKPSIEDRIFMFLDLNDATTFAEKLGSKRFSSLLHDFFNDLDIAFTRTKGYVFQYVGDEVVVIWNLKNGLKNNNCIRAYLLATDILNLRREYYLEKYNVFPTFKASLHCGEITITEIGVSKREIVYHGDTINTTARICASAHQLGKNILISKDLHDKLNEDTNIIFEDLGEHSFKGKGELTHIYSLK